MANADLSLTSVRKEYGNVAILDDINLTIREGEFVSLLGPSGCGKTTMLRIIAGFVEPTSGTVQLGDRILSGSSAHAAPQDRGMGMVFQSYAIWPHMSVRKNIGLPLQIRGVTAAEIDRRVREVAELCQLCKYIDRQPNQLSGGQLQRVAVARALVYEPRVVLLDEPLSNLDVSLREEMRREVHALHRKIGATFILVTHDQVEAMSMSDRVIVMREGRIEQVGEPQDIYFRPKTEFVGQFVGSANVLRGEVLVRETDGRGRVKVGNLIVRADELQNASIGDDVTLVVPPERIGVLEGSGPSVADDTFPGVVTDFSFLGRTQEITVDVSGTSLRAVRMSGDYIAEGTPVLVRLSGHGIIAIPATPDRLTS